ncbi:MAG: serpin family protein [Candidatus Eisenbacteria bacterium]|nr:serpin family protein [Candidatus Eisenbacteria bacterium]
MTLRACSCLLIAMALLALAASSCTSAETGESGESARTGEEGVLMIEPGEAGAESTDELASADAAFALSLYRRLGTREGNVFFSPHSIYTALAMTYVGARGETERQMAEALELPALGEDVARYTPEYRARLAGAFGALSRDLQSETSSDTHVFAEANALWYQTGYGFLDRFISLNREGFGARIEALDFARQTEAARGVINEWVEEETLGKIEELIRPGDLDELVRIVLTNAVYFRGLWAEEFDPEATREAPFHVVPGEPTEDVGVPMMSRKGDYAYAHVESPGLQILELPYAGEKASMLVVLPDEDLPGGVSTVEKSLTPQALEGWISRMGEREVTVSIPRFEITWGTEDIIPDLEAMGITDLFDEKCDLSGIDGTYELYVSKVLHKAFVEVNEEGTEAAAATAVVGRLKASMPLMFRADRPFLFLIRDTETGAILFMGRVTDPTG